MKSTVIGVEHKSGSFTNDAGKTFAYDNYNLHCTRESNRVIGSAVTVLKVKSDLFAEAMADAGITDVNQLVGHMVEYEENRFGKVVDLGIIEG